jgi:ribA/ribD-fused uncharacterized protein
MDAITQAAATARDAVGTAARTAAKTIQATVPVIAPEGKVPTEEELRLFFQNRAKAPEFYTFDPKGNLIIKEALGKGAKSSSKLTTVDGIPTSIKQVYSIPPYRPITKEERDEMEGQRIDKVREMEEAYDAAVSVMRETYANYVEGLEGTTKEDVIEANKNVATADQARHEAMYAVREVYMRAEVPITKVLETEIFDKDRTFGATKIHMLRRSTYPLEKIYVTPGEEIMPVAVPEITLTGVQGGGKAKKEEDAKFTQQLAKDLKIILFGQPNENEYGFLSTFYPVEFVVDGVKYFTIEQALAAEKARLFLDDSLRTRIMKTRAPRSMRTMAAALLMKPPSQTGGMRQIQPHEWDGSIRQDVLRKATLAKFRQHSELRDKLFATGGSILALADTREKRDGIGMALNDVQAANTSVWKGGNLYGKILMEVRSQLRQEDRSDNEVMAGGASTEAIHEETIGAIDYKEAIDTARKGAIMGHMKARAAVRF